MVSVVIPTYNERENILALVDAIASVLNGTSPEVIVVDDRSPDGTGEFLDEAARTRPWLRVLHRKMKPSRSGSVVDGLRIAQGQVLCVMDADLSHDPHLLPQMIRAVQEGAEMVIGSRRVPGGGAVEWPWFRRGLSSVGNGLARLLLRLPFADTMSGYFAMDCHFYKRICDFVPPEGYRTLLEFYVRGRPEPIRELPYLFRNRRQGTSKLTTHVAWQDLKMLVRLAAQTWVDRLRECFHRGRYRRVVGMIGPGRLLDIGCGQPCEGMSHGSFLRFLGRGIGIDLKPIYGPFPFAQASATHLPFLDRSFETVVAMEVVEHLDEHQLEAALKEMRRILSPDGCLVITTPNNALPWRMLWPWWEKTVGRLLWEHTHLLSYTTQSWLKSFEQHFRVSRVESYLGLLLVAKLKPF